MTTLLAVLALATPLIMISILFLGAHWVERSKGLAEINDQI